MKKTFWIFFAIALIFTSCKTDHQPVWKLTLKSRPYVEPLIHDKKFYAFSQAGEVLCASIQNGKTIWSQMVSGPILGRPAFNNDLLFVVTQNGFLYSLNAKTGKANWRIQIQDTFSAPVAIFASNVLLPSETGTIYARSLNDGSSAWRFSEGLKFNTGALIADNNALIGGWNREFYSFRTDGSLNWKFTTADRITEEAVRSENTVYFPSYDHFVYALEIPSGRMIWRIAADHPSNLVLLNNGITCASGKDLITISASSGKVERRLPFKQIIDRLYAFPPNFLIVSHNLYEISSDFARISQVLQAPRAIFKVSTAEGMILASDDLYSIYGYATPFR